MNPETSASGADRQQREREVQLAARRRVRTPLWNLLLLVPLLLTLFPGFYNKKNPQLFDIPFFYWWQFLCIPIGVLCVIVVFRMTRGER
jgi:peptidoglycan/LPS O-acetylase OafA/YrhL